MQKTKTTKKFNLGYFIWMGCNYVINIGFLGNFAVLSNLDRRDAIGIHVLWLISLMGFVVGMYAYVCAKLARIHHSHNNGCAYIFEIFTTAGQNVAYAKQNISWWIIIVLLLNILTHFVIPLIFFATFRRFLSKYEHGNLKWFS